MGTYVMNQNKKLFILVVMLLSFSLAGFAGVNFSDERGYYDAPITLSLTADPGFFIVYTTDGSSPLSGIGQVYGSPLNINTSTVVKAVALNSTDTSDVSTHTYIYLNDVVNQTGIPAGYPSTWATGPKDVVDNTTIITQTADYDMNPAVTQDPNYSAQMLDALTQVPALLVSLAPAELFDQNTGIYTNPQERGDLWERASALEFIDTDGSTLFTENAGFRINGASTRYAGFLKHSFRVKFRGEYGAGKLEYPLFGEDAADEFDSFILRMIGHCSPHDWDGSRRQNTQLHKDQYMKELQEALGHPTARGRFVHLYLNGLYWGLYNLSERPDADFFASYLGGDEEDYDVCANLDFKDGDSIAYYEMIDLVGTEVTSQQQYESIEKVLDIDAFIDYIILNHWAVNQDWDQNNWWAGRNKNDGGKWYFISWDTEWIFNYTWAKSWVVNKNNLNYPTGIHQALEDYVPYKVRFGDHVQCACIEEDGPLYPENAVNHYTELEGSIDKATIAELARWGDARGNPNIDYLTHVVPTFNEIVTEWIPERMTETFGLLALYRLSTYQLYPDVEPVQFSQLGGLVQAGQTIDLTNLNGSGDIYYTLDGSDPMMMDGSVNSTAILYTQPISLSASSVVKARVRASNNIDNDNDDVISFDWSAMCPRTFYTEQDYSGLTINELYYNPYDEIIGVDTIDGTNFEFLELKNNGQNTIDLSGVSFTSGIEFTFPVGSQIQPGGFITLAEDTDFFLQRNGFNAFDQYGGRLSNSGELILLSDPFKHTIDSVWYDDDLPWPEEPDSLDVSLSLLLDPSLDNALPTSWAASHPDPTPDAENFDCSMFSTQLNPIHVNCNGATDGQVIAFAFGGTMPYTYEWSNGATTANLSQIPAGDYELIIKDAKGCLDTIQTTVNEPAAITVNYNISEPTANGNDGVITASVWGGTPPYIIDWDNGATGATNGNLTAGDYLISVMDANGCTFMETITLTGPVCEAATGITFSNVGDNIATLTWTAPADATSYTVEFREQGAPTWQSTNASFAFTILSGLSVCTTYEVRLTSDCNGAAGETSTIETFTTTGCFAACDALVGLYSYNITDQSSFLTWDLYANATYTLYYKEIGAATWQDYDTDFPLSIFFTLDPCTTYEWYVIVHCDTGISGPPSVTQTFTTLGCVNGGAGDVKAEEQIANAFDAMTIYPNPSSNLVNISWPAANDEEIVIQLTDLTGKVLQSDVFQQFEGITMNHSMNVADLPNGLYLVNVIHSEGIKTQKLKVQH